MRLVYFGLATGVVMAGLLLRLMPVGLPYPVVKWGGSVLWAAMVYLLVAAVWPDWQVLTTASVAGAIAGVVELSRLYHAAWLDAFRISLAGMLLLGRVFDGWHFLAYWGTIALVAAADRKSRDWKLMRARLG